MSLNTSDRNRIRFLIASLYYFDLSIQPARAELVSTYSVGALTAILGSKVHSFTRSVKK